MKYIFKSQINSGSFWSFCIIYTIIAYMEWNIYKIHSVHTAILIITPILCFIALALWVNRFYFLENEVKIVYFFRFKNREKHVNFSQIQLVKYFHLFGGKIRQPAIVFVYEGKKFSRIFKPSNSFTHRSFQKRKEILKFLASKGVKIEIISDFDEDKNILS